MPRLVGNTGLKSMISESDLSNINIMGDESISQVLSIPKDRGEMMTKKMIEFSMIADKSEL